MKRHKTLAGAAKAYGRAHGYEGRLGGWIHAVLPQRDYALPVQGWNAFGEILMSRTVIASRYEEGKYWYEVHPE